MITFIKSKSSKKSGLNHPGEKAIIGLAITLFCISFSAFLLIPICYALIGSFFKWQPLTGVFSFLGLENYKNVLSNKLFWASTWRTLAFATVAVIIKTTLALILVSMIHNVKRFQSFFRTTYFLPVITSGVAVSLLWKYFYDPSLGLFNSILNSFGFESLTWLNSPVLVLPSIMFMTIWKDLGYAMVLFLAGLSGIPSSLYEAAEIDGANKLKTFINITVPMIKPTTILVVITSIISYLQVFTPIFLMTKNGGPGTSANTLAYLIYNRAFKDYQFGESSAMAFLLFILIIIITTIQWKIINKGGDE